MKSHSPTPKGSSGDGPPSDLANDFSHRIAAAENVNLRERISRLEGSIATWAADLDEAHDESLRLRSEIESLRSQARAAEDAKL
ncbi:MAG: hypothetical protein AAF368_12180, partial [Planctomycetota bacterium]